MFATGTHVDLSLMTAGGRDFVDPSTVPSWAIELTKNLNSIIPIAGVAEVLDLMLLVAAIFFMFRPGAMVYFRMASEFRALTSPSGRMDIS